MRVTAILTASAAVAIALLSATAPAEAGRKTGTWKYSPEEVYAAQRAQRHQAYGRRGYGYGQGYGQGYAPRGYGQGYRQQGYGQGYRPQGYGGLGYDGTGPRSPK